MLNINISLSRSWQLFYASDFCSLLRPCFILCRLFGCLPYKIKNSNFSPSLSGFIYSTIVTVAFLLSCLVVLYNIDVSGELEYTNVPGMLQHNCYSICALIFSIVTYVCSLKRMQLLQDIEVVSSMLPVENFQKNAKLIHGKDIFGFILLIAITTNLKAAKPLEILAKLSAMFGTLLICVMDSLYIDCVFTIMKCFEYVITKLDGIKDMMVKDDIHILRKNYHEQNNPFILMKLRNVMKAYHLISNVLQKINSIFAPQILTTVTLTFIEVTFSLYFYLLRNWGNEDITDNVRRQIWTTYFVASMSYYSLKMIAIIWVCQKTKEAAFEVGIHIHGTLLGTLDKEIKYEVCEDIRN